MKNIELKLLLIVLLIVILGLVGWSFDWMFLTNVSKSFIPMAPLTSILFLFSGTAYILFLKKVSSSTTKIIAHFLTYFSLILLTIVLVDTIFKLNWNIENVFVKNPELFDDKPIGRISEISSILFYLLNISFLLTPKLSQNNYKNLYGFLTSIIFYTTSVFLVGFIENLPVLYDKNIISIALNSVLCFWLMSLVQLSIINFQFWPFHYLTGDSIQHKLIRIFLPVYFIFFTVFEILTHHFFTNPTEIFSTPIIILIIIILITTVTITISRNIEKNLEIANQNLIKSAERYKKVVDISPSAIIIHINGVIVFQNPTVGKIIGGSETYTIIGRTLKEFIYPEDLKMISNRLKKLHKTGEQTPLIVERLIKEDGTLFYGEVTSFLIDYNEQNAVLTIVNDITERRKTELVTTFYQNISAALLSSDNLIDVLKIIRVELGKIMRTDNFYIAFYNEETGLLKADIEVDEIDEIDEWLAKGSLTGYLMEQGVSKLFSKSDILKLNEKLDFKLVGTLPECWLGVPLIENDKPIGALVVQSYDNQKEYTAFHESILQLIANQLSGFIKSKENETQILESEKSFRGLFHTIGDAIYVQDFEARFIDVNEGVLKMYGYERNEIIGNTPEFLSAPEKNDMNAVFGAFDKVKQGIPQVFEFWGLRKNGEIFPKTVRQFKGTYFGKEVIISLATDITNRKKIELELIEAKEKTEESEALLNLFFSQSLDGFFFMMLDEPIDWNENVDQEKTLDYVFKHQRITKANNAVLEQYLATSEQFIGLTPQDLFEHDTDYGKQVWKKMFDQGKLHVDTIEKKFDGTDMIIEGDYICLYNSKNQITGHFGIQRDVTAVRSAEINLKIAKEKAEESERLKSAFLANMSHEIRTPMNSILGFSDLLMSGNLTEEKKEKYHEIVNSSGKRLMNLISDIIDVSRIDAKQLSMHFTEFNLNNLIDNLNHQFNISPRRKNTTIRSFKSLQDEQSFINCDETRLTQVLSNLLENALKFTKDGTVEFGYNLDKKYIHFYVKDSGVGISEKDHQLIFDRFGQSDNELLTVKAGSGLGLSISKGIVEILGGTIWVESGVNKGATFHFTIPHCFVTKESALIETDHKIIELESNPAVTILIAEDELSNFYYLEAILEDFQFNLIHVENGKDAVEKVKSDQIIDLILMDFNMPIMNGIDATIEIRKTNKTIPIIALTAYAMSEDRERAINAGCNDYLPKPVPRDQLLETVHKYINKDS